MKTLKKITMTLVLALTLSSIIPNVSTTNQVQTVEAKAKTTKTKKPIKKAKKNKVKINKTKATLNKGKKVTLKVSGIKSKVKWSSSKKSIATVTKKGVVTAKKSGTSTITAKVGKKKFTCKVTVKKPITKTTTVSKNKTTTKPKTNDKGLIIVPNPRDKEVGENDPKIYTLLQYDVDNSKIFRTVVVKVANEGNKPITIKGEAYLDNDATDPSKSGKVYLPDFINNTTIDSMILEPDPKDLKWISFAFYPFKRIYVDKKSKLTFNFICDGVEYTTTASYYSAHNDYTKVGDLK